MSLQELGDELRNIKKDKESMKTELIKPGTRNQRIIFGDYRLKIKSTRCKIEYRDIGSAFVLGHPDNGVLGTSALGSGTMGSWTEIETINTSQEITDSAKDLVATWLKDGSGNGMDYIAVGTSSTAYSVDDDTALGSELDRKEVSVDTSTDAKIIFTMEVKSTDSTIIGNTIKEVGLLNASSGGTLGTRYVISDLATINTKEYRFTIDIEFYDFSTSIGIWTTSGLNEIRNWFANQSATQPTYCAWGTGITDPAASDTTLEGEQQRNSFTISKKINFVVTFETLLGFSEANGYDITKSGLFNASTNGVLFVEQKFPAISKNNKFNIYEIDRITIV